MDNKYLNIIKEAIEEIDFQGTIKAVKPFGGGHINDTFLLEYTLSDGKEIKYILQRINNEIFTNVKELMDNYCNICSHLKEQIKLKGGDEERETITVIYTKNGKSYTKDSKGNYWRGILFISNSITMEIVESPVDFYKTGKAFGRFQKQLNSFKVEKLQEIIPNFHNTKVRYDSLLCSVKMDKVNRVRLVQEEIKFIMDREKDTTVLIDMLSKGTLPLRVTHNDAKISNIILDKDTKEGICIVDLDTIMPGVVAYDFGDAIRSGATYATEDEVDLNKVCLELDLYEAFTKGFIEGSEGTFTKSEIESLKWGAKIITLEQGIRFLEDYLNGDEYYKIEYPDQNLNRTRTQLKLVKEIESKWDEIQKITAKYVMK